MSQVKAFPVPVTVEARDGSRLEVQAQLICCPRCEDQPHHATVWVVYSVHDHLHLQCVVCEKTYCEGKCG